MGGETRIHSSDRDGAGEAFGTAPSDLTRRAMLVLSALGLIRGHPYSAPYEDVTIKQN